MHASRSRDRSHKRHRDEGGSHRDYDRRARDRDSRDWERERPPRDYRSSRDYDRDRERERGGRDWERDRSGGGARDEGRRDSRGDERGERERERDRGGREWEDGRDRERERERDGGRGQRLPGAPGGRRETEEEEEQAVNGNGKPKAEVRSGRVCMLRNAVEAPTLPRFMKQLADYVCELHLSWGRWGWGGCACLHKLLARVAVGLLSGKTRGPAATVKPMHSSCKGRGAARTMAAARLSPCRCSVGHRVRVCLVILDSSSHVVQGIWDAIAERLACRAATRPRKRCAGVLLVIGAGRLLTPLPSVMRSAAHAAAVPGGAPQEEAPGAGGGGQGGSGAGGGRWG